jgi:hypothetical protein
MDTTPVFQALGSIGLFPARVFLPAFLTALMLRFGNHLPWLAHHGLFAPAYNHPTWFTSNPSLIVLGVLSVLEVLAQKNAEAKHLLHEFDAWLKAAVAALTSLGVMKATDADFVRHTVQQAGVGHFLLPLLAAAGTFKVSLVRRDVLQPLHEHLEGTHLDRLLSWAEDLWVAFGVLLLVLFPLLMLLLVGLSIGLLYLARRRLRVKEDLAKVPCVNCGTPVYPCAVACPSCRHPVAQPRAVGFLGQSKPYPDEDPAAHPYRLVEKGRCPVCATRLRRRTPHQQCSACGEPVPRDMAFAEAYLGHVGRRLPEALVVSLMLSLVPVIGLVVGAVYYRMVLVLPFGQYLPFGRRFLLRWGIRLLFLVLALLQWIPLLGGFVVPLMAFVSFGAYRSSYRSMALAPRDESAGRAGLTRGLPPGTPEAAV